MRELAGDQPPPSMELANGNLRHTSLSFPRQHPDLAHGRHGNALTGASALGSHALCSQSVQTTPLMVKTSALVVRLCSSRTVASWGSSQRRTSCPPSVNW